MKHLVFLDESSANSKMQPLYARAPKGCRAKGYVPYRHYITVTMITAIRVSGPIAARAFVGAMNQERFQAWLTERLVPCLKKGDVVVMDGSACHKSTKARKIIEDAGCQIAFLPPYSPDFNPDEELWSKVKSILRRLKKRTIRKLLAAVHRAVKQVSSKDCKDFFQHCGYAQHF